MKNLIYQYWDGNAPPGVQAGSDAMKKYAERIGAEYLFEHNPRFVTNLGRYSPHYGSFKPVYTESFHEYDNVLFTDTDVFPVEGLEENIFHGFNADIGICTEPHQPKLRAANTKRTTKATEEKWATVIENRWRVKMPRTAEGLIKVYNSGVVMYSNTGLKKAKTNFVPFKEYVSLINQSKLPTFYTADQNYIHAMLQVAKVNYLELDNDWNSFVHYLGHGKDNRPVNDMRTKTTKFVHIQLSCADHFDADTLWRITNRPQNEWNITYKHGVVKND